METINAIFNAVLEGDATTARTRVEEALKSGITADQILNQGLIAPMTEIGRLFEAGECFIPEMLIAARAMKSGMGYLKPHLVKMGAKAVGRAVIGTVQGDLHDIGKNLVGMMLEGAGFEIVDLGVDVPSEKFINIIQAGHVDIICLSALLTTTMTNMRVTIEALKTAGVRDKVKVMIGGAPVTESFARQIGADGYAPDASSATRLAKTFVSL